MEVVENTHEFLGEVAGTQFKYWVLRMENQLMIHISEANNNHFNDLAVSMPGGQPTTSILGGFIIIYLRTLSLINSHFIGTEIDGNGSERLAGRIAKKLNKQVFISCNVVEDRLASPAIEKRLVEEIQAHPEFF